MRRRLSREERYASILRVAEDVFTEMGYEAATVAEVARRAGVVEGNIYRYVKSKRELLARVISEWYGKKIDELEWELRHIGSVRNRVRFLISAHFRALRDSPGLMRLIITQLRTGNEEFAEIVGKLNQRYASYLRDAIQAGVASGEFRSDAPIKLVRDMIFGGIEHHAARYLLHGGTLDVETCTEQMLEIVLKGLLRSDGNQEPPAEPGEFDGQPSPS